MSDLISRSKLIEEIKSLSIVLGGKQIFSDNAKDSVLRTIDEQPTAYSIDKVVEKLKTDSSVKLYGSQNSDNYMIPVNRAIEIVKQGGVSVANNATTRDDVCEYKITDNMVHAGCNNKQIASAFCWFNECDDYKYCPHCGKKIKVVE